jgi:hypothetical protein
LTYTGAICTTALAPPLLGAVLTDVLALVEPDLDAPVDPEPPLDAVLDVVTVPDNVVIETGDVADDIGPPGLVEVIIDDSSLDMLDMLLGMLLDIEPPGSVGTPVEELVLKVEVVVWLAGGATVVVG